MINVSYIHTKNSNDITCLNIAVEGIIPNEDKKKKNIPSANPANCKLIFLFNLISLLIHIFFASI